MRSNSNARNATPSQGCSFAIQCLTTCKGKSLRDSEKLREALLCACARESVHERGAEGRAGRPGLGAAGPASPPRRGGGPRGFSRPRGARRTGISPLRLSLLRLLDSNHPGKFPMDMRIPALKNKIFSTSRRAAYRCAG